MLGEIDLQDGDFGEWEELIGPPTLTPLDFWLGIVSGSGVVFEKYSDPSDLAFQIWLGWNDAHERIYMGAVFSDDTYIDNSADHDRFTDADGLTLTVDSDHAGGILVPSANLYAIPSYHAIAQAAEGPNVQISVIEYGEENANDGKLDWVNRPPYADSGGALFSEQPIIWVVEFYVTAFNFLNADTNADESVVSDLAPEKVIGLGIWVRDLDDERRNAYRLSEEYDVEGTWNEADFFVDALLIGADDMPVDETAVMSDSWARIKASFSD